MENTTRIFIVEDDMIIAANISLQLTNLGYQVTGIVSRGEEAIVHVKENSPDILLLDINLRGNLDGIETAKAIQSFRDIPIIYLTANSDEATFAKAKETHPRAFINKPFSKLNLIRSVELVVEQLKESGNLVGKHLNLEVLSDRVFVRHNGKMTRLLLDDILFVEADRNYCNIVCERGSYMLSSTLKSVEKQLPKNNFIRVHRSFMVNLFKLDVVTEHHLEINRKVIPLSKSHKDLLMSRIHMI